MVSLGRRRMPAHMRNPLLTALTFGACVAAIFFGQPVSAADSRLEAPNSLQRALTQLAAAARPGTLGIAVSDLQTGRIWRVNARQAFPLMSVFKAPLGATVLSEVDQGTLSLRQTVRITRSELMTAGRSKIAATFRGNEETFSVGQLLEAAVSHSDNTAADVLLELVGGPAVVTAFLRTHGIQDMRIDRGEDEIAREFQVSTEQRAEESKQTPAARHARLRGGYEAFLNDPRDRATPGAAVQFLRKLWQGDLLSSDSTRRLLILLYGQTIPDRLRAGIPPGVRLADKCGTSYSVDGMTAAFNDMGIITWPDGHTVIVAAFLMASHASEHRRNALFKDIAQAITTDLHP